MIRFLAYLGESYRALMRNKARSFLTMLGMLIGVASVISVYGLSSAAATGIDKSISSGDAPGLTVAPDPKQADPAIAQLQFRDATVIGTETAGVTRRVLPFYSRFAFSGSGYQIKYNGQKITAGSFSWYGDDGNFKVVAGRAFTAPDVDAAANVTVVSHDLAVQFWGSDAAAVGQFLSVSGRRFDIVGVADETQGTAAQYFGGTYYFVLPFITYRNFDSGTVDVLLVWPSDPNDEASARTVMLGALHHLHGLRAQYDIRSLREQIQTYERIFNVIAAGLSAIGAISLFVAGIGIMNIMLVSVTERTREIGIRKSIGASRRDLMTQFIMEAALISVIGGAIGLLLSLVALSAGGSALGRSLQSPLQIPYGRVFALAVVFSLGVGMTFGVYPAWRASALDPVEALRS